MATTAVIICDCMGMVSDHLDTGSLEELAGRWDEVGLVKRVGKLCGKAQLDALAQELRGEGIQRLIYAGCSPRMSLKLPEQLLEDTARLAGIDPSLVEVANIREQCAWLHTDDQAAASAKGRDMLRMARARLLRAEPTAEDVSLERQVLVIGAGAAGLAATDELSRAGLPVTLVEQNAYLGGAMCQLPYIFQSEGWPSSCESQCVGPVHARQADTSPLVTALTSATVISLDKEDGNFTARVALEPRFVDPDKCIACGSCAQVCPETAPNTFDLGLSRRKAIAKDFPRAVPDAFTLLDEACTRCGD